MPRTAGAKPKRLLLVVGLMMAFVWVTISLRFRDVAPEPPPEPADLRAWDFLGCHRLQFDTWVSDDDGEPAAADPPVVRSLILFPDSVDQYGRRMSARRAVPLEADADMSGLETRWFTRADTLWLIWSSSEVRGAVALRRSRGSMVGRAVARLRGQAEAADAGGGGSVQAPASAWEVNCHSLRPNRIGPVER
ncbi:hypothetical protein [Candidatus Palauibacter sp.]|uniref:hypothetical protein n=1 Tax=Candidatus Palauibacter sp. TaxID=3101350 RepID=UPI003AF1F371